MPDAQKTKTLETMLKDFIQLDEVRKTDPVMGRRRAETKLMEICEFIKANDAAIEETARAKVVKHIQGMNLQPYRSYCREHLLDIGIDNI